MRGYGDSEDIRCRRFHSFREEIDFGHRDLYCINVPLRLRITLKPLFKQMFFTYVLRITYL